MFYAPSESYALFGAENGELCGTLATVNDKTVLMLTEKGQLALKKEGISPFSQSDIQKSSTGMYYDVGRDHQIRENSNSGSTIVLEDGSIWEIGSMDQMIAMSWRVSTSITVSSTGSGSYGYVLINNDDEKTVHANFIGKK
jgi:hypothetical protein